MNNLIFGQSDNSKLTEALELVNPRPTTGSLVVYNRFDFAELYRFRQIFHHYLNNTITGSESFPKEMLNPRKDNVFLLDDIYEILVQYYNTAYDWKFMTISETASVETISEDFIIILPNVNQYEHICIRAKIFRATITSQYMINLHILVKFV